MREEKYGTITEKSRTDILRELKPSFKKKKWSLTCNESEVKANFVLANLIVTKGKNREDSLFENLFGKA